VTDLKKVIEQAKITQTTLIPIPSKYPSTLPPLFSALRLHFDTPP